MLKKVWLQYRRWSHDGSIRASADGKASVELSLFGMKSPKQQLQPVEASCSSCSCKSSFCSSCFSRFVFSALVAFLTLFMFPLSLTLFISLHFLGVLGSPRVLLTFCVFLVFFLSSIFLKASSGSVNTNVHLSAPASTSSSQDSRLADERIID